MEHQSARNLVAWGVRVPTGRVPGWAEYLDQAVDEAAREVPSETAIGLLTHPMGEHAEETCPP